MTPSDRPNTETPLDDFSQCLVAIVGRLAELDRLPALVEAAAHARKLAGEVARFFDAVVREHHSQEERELFPAVLASAHKGEEQRQVADLVARLTQEHRTVEAAFDRLMPALKAAAKGQEAALDPAAVAELVAAYRAHAEFEEREFLPLSQLVLGRNGDHMAALGIAMHLRHAVPEVLARVGYRI